MQFVSAMGLDKKIVLVHTNGHTHPLYIRTDADGGAQHGEQPLGHPGDGTSSGRRGRLKGRGTPSTMPRTSYHV